MDTHDPQIAQLFDDAGRLRVSLPCVRCGYDLRTLPRDGCCPECGHTVRETLLVAPAGDTWRMTRFSPWSALGILASGQGLLSVALLVTLTLTHTTLLDIVPPVLEWPLLLATAMVPCAATVGLSLMVAGAVGLCDAAAKAGLTLASRPWVRGYLVYQAVQVPLVLLCVLWFVGSRNAAPRAAATAAGCSVLLAGLGLTLAACRRLSQALRCRRYGTPVSVLGTVAWALALCAAGVVAATLTGGPTRAWAAGMGLRFLPRPATVATSVLCAYALILGLSGLVVFALARQTRAVYAGKGIAAAHGAARTGRGSAQGSKRPPRPRRDGMRL